LSSGHIFSRSIFIFGSFASRRRVFFPPASSTAPPSPLPAPLVALASASLASGLGRDIPGLLFVRLDVGLPLLALQPVDLVAKRLPRSLSSAAFSPARRSTRFSNLLTMARPALSSICAVSW